MAVLGRQVDAAELEVARHVLQEVDELQSRADVVARGDELRLPFEPQQTEHEAADGIGGVAAVLAQVVPRLVCGDPLIHPVRLDQPEERVARERELADRRLQHAHDRPAGLSRVTGFHLALELVERGEAVTLDLVPEDVDETREAVDRAQVGPQAAWKEQRSDRKVLRPCASCNGGHVHGYTFAHGGRQVV